MSRRTQSSLEHGKQRTQKPVMRQILLDTTNGDVQVSTRKHPVLFFLVQSHKVQQKPGSSVS